MDRGAWRDTIHGVAESRTQLSDFTFFFFYDYTVEVRNRFKGLDLIDRLPEDIWTEVPDIVQEAGIKTIPQKRNAKRPNGCLRRLCKEL